MLGPLAGMSIAMTMIMLKSGDNMLFGSEVGRWVLIALFGIIGLFGVSLTKWTGAVSYTDFVLQAFYIELTSHLLDIIDSCLLPNWELAVSSRYRYRA